MSLMTRFTWVRIGGICTPKTGSRYVGLTHPRGGSGYVGFATAKLGLSVWDGTVDRMARPGIFKTSFAAVRAHN